LLLFFSEINISQGSVETRLRFGRIFTVALLQIKFTAKSVRKTVLKIGQHLAKLEGKI